MIKLFKSENKIIGVYELILTKEQLITISDIKQYLVDNLMEELKKESQSDLFTYQILEINECVDIDLYGKKVGIVFEFVPNKEAIEELKAVDERLKMGL